MSRQVAPTVARKKQKAAGKQPGQQAKTGQKLTKLAKFQQKKTGYEMSIMAVKRTLAVQVQRAFELFEFILREDASERWREITIRVCDDNDWVNEEGNKQTTKRGQTWVTLSACRREFMLQIFAKDAAEQQDYYRQFCIRKRPRRIKLRPFVRRLLSLSRSI